MTSILKVDTIQDTAGNNIINESGDTITIGASGDTITIPSGATTTLTDGIAGDLKFNSGFGSIATAYGCRAWVNFDGTGTPAIRESGNVTSITDNGTGDYTVNFTTAMPDANYTAITTGGFASGSARPLMMGETDTPKTTSAFRFDCQNYLGSQTDPSNAEVAIFR
jgi:hypothetical protein